MCKWFFLVGVLFFSEAQANYCPWELIEYELRMWVTPPRDPWVKIVIEGTNKVFRIESSVLVDIERFRDLKSLSETERYQKVLNTFSHSSIFPKELLGEEWMRCLVRVLVKSQFDTQEVIQDLLRKFLVKSNLLPPSKK